jgi:alanyl-tRNA synthetase
VRVVCVGHEIEPMLNDPLNPKWENYSVEFCGGTHLQNVRQAAHFGIVSESGLAQGVRRIIAFTGSAAQEAVSAGEGLKRRLKELEESKLDDVSKELSSLRAEIDRKKGELFYADKTELDTRIETLVKKLHKLRSAGAKSNAEAVITSTLNLISDAIQSGKCVIALEINVGSDAKALKDTMTKALESHPRVALMLFSTDTSKGKLLVYSGVSDSLQTANSNALTWLQSTLAQLGGKGGGKPSLAQGQAPLSPSFDMQHAISVSHQSHAFPAI